MLRAITITAYRRPAYTREVLSALANCDGIADWILLPNVEPGNDEVIAAFREWDACDSRLLINRHRLGLNKNTHDALVRAHQLRADVIVHFEDDTVPSPDALRFFEWAAREVLIPDVRSSDGHQITLAAGYNRLAKKPDDPFLCGTRPIFTCWGWAVDRKRLRWMLTNWCFRDPGRFTTPFRRGYRNTRREVYPMLSRIQNIGLLRGTNDTIQGRRTHHTPFVAGDISGQFSISANISDAQNSLA